MPEGRIDGSNASDFHRALIAVGRDAGGALVLDMERLTYISSAGLRVILQTTRTLHDRGGRLVVCSLSNMVGEVFEISGFHKIIETHESRADAIASCGDLPNEIER